MLQFLQNYPHLLEVIYDFTNRLLQPFQRWLKPDGGSLGHALTWSEELGKRAIFDCQMCGQCILHSTGMTCPMTCPKNLRNGPCGGVRLNGHCEVKPEMRCIWVEAFERSQKMPTYGQEILNIQPPLNQQLQGSSAWINALHGIDKNNQNGWVHIADIHLNNSSPGNKDKSAWTQISNQAAA